MSRPARVLLVTPRYPPSLGGIERHVAMLAAELAGRGLHVGVATTGREPTTEADQQANPSIRRFSTLRDDEVFFLSPRLALWLLRDAGRYDLVHVHSYHTPVALLGAIAAWLHRVPFVATPHYHGTGHTRARQLLHRPYRQAGRWMVRHAALVLCNSEAERALIVRDFGPDLRTKVVLPGIDAAGAMGAARPVDLSGRVVLAGGRLERYKQVDLVVAAMAALPPDFRLVVFGEGPDLERIVGTAADLGVTDRVEVAGRLPDDSLKAAFRDATVFVSLSRQEAFGLTVLEAAAAGTPVVCTDIPAYREVSGLLRPGAMTLLDVDVDPPAVAEAIEAASAAPRPHVPFATMLPTWRTMASGILDGYADVLHARRRNLRALRPVPDRIHVTGGSGTGKTTIARQLAAQLDVPLYHLDNVALDQSNGRLRPGSERRALVADIVARPRWVTEGIHVGWTDDLVGHADTVLWLDHIKAPTAMLRVARRFVGGGVAEIRRSRGLRRFFRPASYRRHLAALWRATGEIRAYERGPAEQVGDSGSRAATAAQLAPVTEKVIHCTSQADVDAFVAELARQVNAARDRGRG